MIDFFDYTKCVMAMNYLRITQFGTPATRVGVPNWQFDIENALLHVVDYLHELLANGIGLFSCRSLAIYADDGLGV